MSFAVAPVTTPQISTNASSQAATSREPGLIERVCKVVLNILVALWQCLVRFFSPQPASPSLLEDNRTWSAMVDAANSPQHEAVDSYEEFLQDVGREGWSVVESSQLRAPAMPSEPHHSLTNETLQRICTNTTRVFTRVVETNQFEKNYASCIKNGSEDNVFEQLDMDLQRNAAVYIGPRKFSRSTEIFEELIARGIDKTRCIKILSCLSQGACSEAWVMMKRLFANIEGEEAVRRHPALDAAPYPFIAQVNFTDSHVDLIELFMEFKVNSLSPERPLFNVSVRTLIDGAIGRAVVTGMTSGLR